MDIKGGNKWQECGMAEDSATINNNRGYPGCGCLSPWYPSQAAPAHRRLPGIGFLQGTRSTVYRVRPHRLIGVYLEQDSSKVLGLQYTESDLNMSNLGFTAQILFSKHPPKNNSLVIISLLTYIEKTKTKLVTSSKSLLSRMGEKTHSQKPHTEPWQRDRAFHPYCPGGNS